MRLEQAPGFEELSARWSGVELQALQYIVVRAEIVGHESAAALDHGKHAPVFQCSVGLANRALTQTQLGCPFCYGRQLVARSQFAGEQLALDPLDDALVSERSFRVSLRHILRARPRPCQSQYSFNDLSSHSVIVVGTCQ